VGYKATIRAYEAAQRRQQRDAQRRLRELELQAKEQAKRSAIEQAKIEVETYENGLEVLLSVHKEQGEVWDWIKLATALPPHSPRKYARHELRAKQHAELRQCLGSDQECDESIKKAGIQDEQELQEALQTHTKEMAEWEDMKSFAQRILDGELKAYTEALSEFSGLAEISDLGSSVHFTVHNAKLIESSLKVKGQNVVPAEVKSVTAAGKLSVKAMPSLRFHEIYQDYVCGCVLRVAREVFAVLPVEMVLITALVDMIDSSTGQMVAQPVLSVAVPRVAIGQLDFEHLDPSDSIENFLHRGDAKASRKSGEFERITPLAPDDLPETHSVASGDYRDFFGQVRQMREEIKAELGNLTLQPASVVSQMAQ
jgi:hypothetical protein